MSDKKTIENVIDLDRLKDLINEEKSRQVIADKIGCDVSLITRHYNAQKIVTIDFLKKYAEYFNVSADYLLGLTDASTNDRDLRFICDYTGLSERTIRGICDVEYIADDIADRYDINIEDIEADVLKKIIKDKNGMWDSMISDNMEFYRDDIVAEIILREKRGQLYTIFADLMTASGDISHVEKPLLSLVAKYLGKLNEIYDVCKKEYFDVDRYMAKAARTQFEILSQNLTNTNTGGADNGEEEGER